MEHQAGALTTGNAATVTASDQARIAAALAASRSANTARAYASAWSTWRRWATDNGHQTMPAAPVAVAAYLTHRAEQGAAVATVRMARAAISAAHRQGGADDPCQHAGRPPGARRHRTHRRRSRGRGQVQGLDWRGADLAAGIAANGGGTISPGAAMRQSSPRYERCVCSAISEAEALDVADVQRSGRRQPAP